MSDENKLNVKFEWVPEFGKLLMNLVWPGKHWSYTRLLHCNELLAATCKNYGQFSNTGCGGGLESVLCVLYN